MKSIVLLLGLLISTTSIANTVWTNEARYPSNSKDRGLKATLEIVKKLEEVPDCAKARLASKILYGTGQNLYVSNELIMDSSGIIYGSIKEMSFKKDNEDYIDKNIILDVEPFNAKIYKTYCKDKKPAAIAYFPNCQNLGTLEEAPEQNKDFRNQPLPKTKTINKVIPGTIYTPFYNHQDLGRDDEEEVEEIPIISILPLFLLGFLILRIFK